MPSITNSWLGGDQEEATARTSCIFSGLRDEIRVSPLVVAILAPSRFTPFSWEEYEEKSFWEEIKTWSNNKIFSYWTHQSNWTVHRVQLPLQASGSIRVTFLKEIQAHSLPTGAAIGLRGPHSFLKSFLVFEGWEIWQATPQCSGPQEVVLSFACRDQERNCAQRTWK